VLLTLGQELLIGVVLGLLARLTIASLQIAGSVVASRWGLAFSCQWTRRKASRATSIARALHAAVEVDQEIPPEHYKAVAEVIGYVMKLRRATGQPR
jgi:FlhB HrpN YscU SpaS Family/Bacterial export proteins, family 1